MTDTLTFPRVGYSFTLTQWKENDGRGHLTEVDVQGTKMIRLHALHTVAMLEAQLTIAAIGGEVFNGTSVTSMTIGTGAHTFTTQTTKAFGPGAQLRIVDVGDINNFMVGTVTAYDTATGAVTVTVVAGDTGGSGTHASWSIASTGATGAAGGITGGTMTGALDMGGHLLTADAALFRAGSQWQQTDLGTVSMAQAVAASANGFIKATLAADVTFTFAVPTAGHGYSKLVKVIQDSTGGRVPTFQLSGPVAVIWIGDEPPWGSRTSGQSNYVTILVTPDGEIFASAFHGSA